MGYKTKVNYIVCLLCLLSAMPMVSHGQTEAENGEEQQESSKKEVGPKVSDAASAKIIANHNKSRGGIDKIKSIKSTKKKGTLREGKKYYNMLWYRKVPNKYRVERHYRLLGQDYRTVWAYDGETAWIQEFTPKKQLPKLMGKGEAKEFALEADFYGPLVDWKEKGHAFAYDGKAKVYSTPAYLVRAQIKNGPLVYYYFDTKNFLVRRYGFTAKFAGASVYADYYVQKLKKANDVWMEQRREYTADLGVYKTIEYDSIQANVDISDSLFVMPKIKEYWIKSRDN